MTTTTICTTTVTTIADDRGSNDVPTSAPVQHQVEEDSFSETFPGAVQVDGPGNQADVSIFVGRGGSTSSSANADCSSLVRIQDE